ncbi:MAG: HDOD domain-containing protein [Syntrophomonadaceae bacterium]|nr:HDOD domain-containing protein [Syntrophomonadaceae bacterium]
MGMVSLEQLVAAVNDLPALPHVVVKVMQLSEDPDSTAQDINNVLTQDQSMTARVLRLANSAFYGFPRRISTVTDAVVLLGFRTIRSIVLAASVSEILNQEVGGYALEPGELWRHSQSSAIAARMIAKRVKYPALDVAYTAALLHDIGKVILNNNMKEAYREVVEKIENTGIPFNEVETDVMGFNHAQVGAQVAEKWNLPPELVEAIMYHHEPEKATINKKLTAIVHVADAVSVTMGIGVGIDGMLYPVSSEAMQLLGIDEIAIESIISEMADVVSDQQSFSIEK